MKKIVILFVLIAIAAGFLYRQRTAQSVVPVHLHAGFQVYQNNILQDFTDLKYQNTEPCNENDEAHEPEDEQLEKAHLHNNIGDVVHIHRAGVVWQDLFTNLNVTLDPNATAYLNGQPIKDFLNTPIEAYDSLVIFEGETTDIQNKLNRAITKDHILEVEATSETCGT